MWQILVMLLSVLLDNVPSVVNTIQEPTWNRVELLWPKNQAIFRCFRVSWHNFLGSAFSLEVLPLLQSHPWWSAFGTFDFQNIWSFAMEAYALLCLLLALLMLRLLFFSLFADPFKVVQRPTAMTTSANSRLRTLDLGKLVSVKPWPCFLA